MNTILHPPQPIAQVSPVSVSVSVKHGASNCTDNTSNIFTERLVTKLNGGMTIDFSFFTDEDLSLFQDHVGSRQNSRNSIDSLSSSVFNSSFSNSFITSTISPSLKSAYSIKRASSFRNSQKPKRSSFYDDPFFDTSDSRSNSRSDSSSISHFAPLLSYRSSISSNDLTEIHPLSAKNVPPSLSEDRQEDEKQDTGYEKNDEDDDIDKKPIVTEHNSSNLDTNVSNHSKSNSININTKNTKNNTPLAEIKSSPTSNIISFLKKMKTSINKSLDPNPINVSTNRIIPDTPLDDFKLHQMSEVPLKTFSQKYEKLPTLHENIEINSLDNESILPLHFFGKTRRIRENRINSKYLLLYSLDASTRLNGYLNQFTDEELDIFDSLLLETYNQISDNFDSPSNEQLFDSDFKWKLESRLLLASNFNLSVPINNAYINNIKLASIARFKLWSTATLPPRQDDLPNFSNIINDISPLPSLNTCQVPWVNIKDLKSGRAINKLTQFSGLLKNSNIQYVSKRCSSQRWVCLNNNTNMN